jgi:hypothetical protein
MAILYDARGNEIRVSYPDSVTGEVITDARPITAVLGAINAEVLIDLNGADAVNYDVRTAAGALTFLVEATLDGTNYFALPIFVINQLLGAVILVPEQYLAQVVVATTINGQYTVKCSGYRRVRIRVSAYTSGNITVAARASIAVTTAYNRHIPSTLHITVTAAANTAATATLPAAGVGMYHYITSIVLMRNATAALAGTATLIHTSTNLPGNPAWSVGNLMAAGGTQLDLNYSPTTPLKSLVANTATSVSMVAGGAAVLNRVNVSYYVGA